MAAEARADSSAPAAAAPPPLPVPEKRSLPEDGGEESRPGTKRRRACVAALDGVPGAAAAGGHGEEDGPSFSFQHARGGFAALETTPKFGSFNPPAAAQQEALDPARSEQDSPAVREEEDTASAIGVEEGGKDGNSQSVAAADDEGRRHPERHNTESER